MTRTMSFLAIALTLTGCVEDKPAPRLSSPNRSERIEAVKVARDKYGTRAPASPAVNIPAETPSQGFMLPPNLFRLQPAGDDQAIVGSWNHSTRKHLDYFQFAANGTFKEVAELNTTKGNWCLLSADTIQFSALHYSNPAIPSSVTVMEFKYRLDGDSLWLKGVHGGGTHYTRATDKEKQP